MFLHWQHKTSDSRSTFQDFKVNPRFLAALPHAGNLLGHPTSNFRLRASRSPCVLRCHGEEIGRIAYAPRFPHIVPQGAGRTLGRAHGLRGAHPAAAQAPGEPGLAVAQWIIPPQPLCGRTLEMAYFLSPCLKSKPDPLVPLCRRNRAGGDWRKACSRGRNPARAGQAAAGMLGVRPPCPSAPTGTFRWGFWAPTRRGIFGK